LHYLKNKLSKKTTTYILMIIFICTIFSGCSGIDSLKVKLGLKNNDFEYIKQNKINKIVIQSTRDPGFIFVLTDQGAIDELYNILSTAKQVNQKSTLAPDYIFEMDEGQGTIHKFKYVAGLDKSGYGNFYSDDKVYVVSKRIDNDIINNFWDIRKPNDFQNVYYNSILQTINQYFKGKDKTKSIGVDIEDDIDVAKFILSNDLQDFKDNLTSNYKNIEIENQNKDKFDVLVTVSTQGYESTLYKGIITFWDKNDQTENDYYIFDKYENGGWNIQITADKPSGF
jgi:hypothetical protein